MSELSIAQADKFIIFLQFTLVFFHFFSRKAEEMATKSIFVIVTAHFGCVNLFTIDGFPCFKDVPKNKWNQQ